jgi:hypothetical protein
MMSKKKDSKIKNWRINYQDRIEYYESQAAAMVAVDLIISSCETGIWGGKSYLFLSHEEGDAIDRDLLNSHYSTNVMLPTSFEDMFTIDLFVKNKEDWIFKHGSDLLQQSILAGYECNDGYLAERVARDHPGFTVNDRSKYKKVDTPTESCLYACLGYENAYCSSNNNSYYITIDNFLGKYQLIKPISNLAEIPKLNSIRETVADSLSSNIVPMVVLIGSLFTLVTMLLLLIYADQLGLLL